MERTFPEFRFNFDGTKKLPVARLDLDDQDVRQLLVVLKLLDYSVTASTIINNFLQKK